MFWSPSPTGAQAPRGQAHVPFIISPQCPAASRARHLLGKLCCWTNQHPRCEYPRKWNSSLTLVFPPANFPTVFPLKARVKQSSASSLISRYFSNIMVSSVCSLLFFNTCFIFLRHMADSRVCGFWNKATWALGTQDNCGWKWEERRQEKSLLTWFSLLGPQRGGALRSLFCVPEGRLNFQKENKSPEGKSSAANIIDSIYDTRFHSYDTDIIVDIIDLIDIINDGLWLYFNPGRAEYLSPLHFSHYNIVHNN